MTRKRPEVQSLMGAPQKIMPELPEVEITKRKLEPLIKSKRILNLGGKKILRIERKGKAILIYLSGGKILGFHQRMSGKLLIVRRGWKDKHTRRIFHLSGGKDLAFHDVRRFGVIWYGPVKKVLDDPYFKTLGLDALKISFGEFKRILGERRAGKLKPFFLNQKNLAGVGNIIADEVLWHAKIHPERNINNLSDADIKKLYVSLKFILKRSIKLGGSTMRDWFHPDGGHGGYFKKRYTYGREDEKCFRCKTQIIRKKIASHSSCFCPKCQREQ